MRTKIIYTIILGAILLTGCNNEEPVINVDTRNDQGGAVMALDYRDFERTANDMVQSLISSGRLKDDGSRYIIMNGRIINDTALGIDTDQLMVKIRRDLTNSGLATFTAAVGSNTDQALLEARQLRNSDEFDQTTTVDKNTLYAPELSIAGKNYTVDSWCGRRQTAV